MKSFLAYLSASRAELAKVVWPNRRQAVRLTVTVIVFSVIVAAFLGVIDFGLSTLLQKAILKG